MNQYRNGETQREVTVESSRKFWQLSQKLSPADPTLTPPRLDELVTLREFFVARRGKTEPFWFYDFFEATVFGNWDPTGASPDGRFKVRFNSDFSQTLVLGRAQVSLSLAECA